MRFYGMIIVFLEARGDVKITSNVNNSTLRRIGQLINHDDHTWNENPVRNIFMSFDADKILKIRLPNYEDDDFISWTPERHGMFMVCIAYNLAFVL